MKYTDKEYYIEEKLREKLDLMIDRMTGNKKKDNLLLIEGAEGDGKTNMSISCAYYVKFKTHRKFNENNLFFDTEKMVEFAINNSDQIIIWDEPALGGLSSEWFKQTQKTLMKMLMMSRKKRHFFIFNFTSVFKFKDYFCERAIGMIRVYLRKQKEYGHFVYYNKSSLNILYETWRRTRLKKYKKFTSFRGTFPYVLPELINEEIYEKEKDKAILSLLDKPEQKKEKLDILKYHYANLEIPQKELAERLKVSLKTIQRWKKLDETAGIKPSEGYKT